MFPMDFKCFQAFLQVFSSIFFLYVAVVASRCFKNRSGVAHGMCVGSGWWRGHAGDVWGGVDDV
jgi:hypothetical protein